MLPAGHRWVVEGRLKMQIDMEAEWGAAGVQAAYARLGSRRTRGKVVVRVHKKAEGGGEGGGAGGGAAPPAV